MTLMCRQTILTQTFLTGSDFRIYVMKTGRAQSTRPSLLPWTLSSLALVGTHGEPFFPSLSAHSLLSLYLSPGRFFAVNEIKAMLAHVLLNYDVKLADGKRPECIWQQGLSAPNPFAKVLFRKRATT